MSLDPIKRNLPEFDPDRVKALARELYGLDGEYSQQSSERDLSWRVLKDDGESVVLKIANSNDPEAIIDFQTRALDHINRVNPALPVPRVIHSLNDQTCEWIESATGDRHLMRLLTFLPGDPIDSRPDALTGKMRYRLGALVAELDIALRSFFHSAARSNEHLWELTRCLEIRPQIELLTDAEVRSVCHRVLDRAEQQLIPRLPHLRWQVIHQDASENNTLVDHDNPEMPAGIIDFGDLLYGPLLAELATIDTTAIGEKDPVGCLCSTAAGFDSRLPLEEIEVDLLYDATLVRHVSNIILIGARDAIGDSDGYLSGTDKYVDIVDKMLAEGPDRADRKSVV